MGAGGGRFGKLFSDEEHLALGDPGRNALRELARRLVLTQNTSTQNLWLPAGYTYLGQFIDHDITFDPTSKPRSRQRPGALRNFRTRASTSTRCTARVRSTSPSSTTGRGRSRQKRCAA